MYLKDLPVAVSSIVNLNVSASITCAPDEGPVVGDKRAVMAWMPCKVPARTRYSFAVSCARPSRRLLSLRRVRFYLYWRRTREVTLVDQATRFVDDLNMS